MGLALKTEKTKPCFSICSVPDDDDTAHQMSKENGLSFPCSSITLPTNFPKGSCKLLVKLKSGYAPETLLSLSSPGNYALHAAVLTLPVEPDLFLRLVCSKGNEIQFRGAYLGAESINKHSHGEHTRQQ